MIKYPIPNYSSINQNRIQYPEEKQSLLKDLHTKPLGHTLHDSQFHNPYNNVKQRQVMNRFFYSQRNPFSLKEINTWFLGVEAFVGKSEKKPSDLREQDLELNGLIGLDPLLPRGGGDPGKTSMRGLILQAGLPPGTRGVT